MSEFTIAEQTFVFLQACVLGVFIGLIYDFFRSIRIVCRAKTILTAVFDILFSLILIIALFLFFVNNTDGIMRLYTFAGVILGSCLYFFSVSSPIVGISVKAMNGLIKAFLYGVSLACLPLKKLKDRSKSIKKEENI